MLDEGARNKVKTRSFRWALGLLSVSTIAVFSFQNCSKAWQSMPRFSAGSLLSTSLGPGNGDGYDGKLYVNTGGLSECAGGTLSGRSTLVEQAGRTFVVRDNCAPSATPIDVTDQLAPLIPHPDYDLRVYSNRIFDYRAPDKPDDKQVISVNYCGGMISAEEGVVVGITTVNFISFNYRFGSAYQYMKGSARPLYLPIGAGEVVSKEFGDSTTFATTDAGTIESSWTLTIHKGPAGENKGELRYYRKDSLMTPAKAPSTAGNLECYGQ
jgi:hypothetical protein